MQPLRSGSVNYDTVILRVRIKQMADLEKKTTKENKRWQETNEF